LTVLLQEFGRAGCLEDVANDCFMAVGNQEKLGKRTILQVYYGGKCTDHTKRAFLMKGITGSGC